jgi:hypothetical protein
MNRAAFDHGADKITGDADHRCDAEAAHSPWRSGVADAPAGDAAVRVLSRTSRNHQLRWKLHRRGFAPRDGRQTRGTCLPALSLHDAIHALRVHWRSAAGHQSTAHQPRCSQVAIGRSRVDDLFDSLGYPGVVDAATTTYEVPTLTPRSGTASARSVAICIRDICSRAPLAASRPQFIEKGRPPSPPISVAFA